MTPRALGRAAIAYVLIWIPMMWLYALILVAMKRVPLPQALLSGVVVMGTAALLSLGVWKLSARLPLPERGRLGFYLIQLLLAAVYTATWLGIAHGWLVVRRGPELAEAVVQRGGLWYVFQGFWLYGATAAISYVIRTQRRLRQQQIAQAQVELEAARARLAALRAQLRPHFLFNALHSVGALIRSDAGAAEQALDRLGALLRYTLDEGEESLVYLADDWQFTTNYLALERLRLGSRLVVESDLARDALECLVPSFLLQPLVENSIRHAIAIRPQGGTLWVAAARHGDRLEIEVRDDGPGADPNRLSAATGMGLSAVRRHLEMCFDGRSQMIVDTAPGAGFRVRLLLPAETQRRGSPIR